MPPAQKALPRETDVFVVGGGPAGLAAAIAARMKGLRAVVADSAMPPINKACGEGLMPDALAALRALGVDIGPEHSFPFRGIRFLEGGTSVDASFPSGFGLGVRRTILHELLVRRAAEVGVSFLWGARVSGLSSAGVLIGGEELQCRWVIGADGHNSRVRMWAGLDRYRHDSHRFAFRRHYRIAPWTDCMEMYWAQGCQIYVTPVSREEVCVCAISRASQFRLEHALKNIPEVARRLEGAVLATTERGAISVSRRLRKVYRGRAVLIGDASGSVDAITGEGMCLSFRQAIALADSLAHGNLAEYARAHERLARRPAFMASLMLSLDRSPWLRRRALRALASKPAIFSNLLATHLGERSSAESVLGMLPLGWRILTI
jgi:menaquinone-9 beta-reductase